MKYITNIKNIVVIVSSIILISCGSSDVARNYSAEERFEMGKAKFNDGDYLEAISEFEIIKLQYTGSSVADDAQYYLAECHFMREEYLLASEEYQVLKRRMSSSPLIPQAQFKIAMCFYNLSPQSALDQKYTKRAIDEFQTFLEYYPKDGLASEADTKIIELNTRLAQKLYDTADLYMTLENYKGAELYYNSVIEKYHDTKYAEPALIGKVKALVLRKKYRDAKENIEKFLERYPASPMIDEAKGLAKDIDENINDKMMVDPSLSGIKDSK